MKNIKIKESQSNICRISVPDYTVIPIQFHEISKWVNLQIQCWQETYSSMNLFNSNGLNQYWKKWTLEKRKTFQNPNTYKVFLLWKGKPIGFCEAGKPRYLPFEKECYFIKNVFVKGEILRIYILKEHQGKGLGSQLFLSAIDWLQKTDQVPLRVWAFTKNVQANLFYQKMNGIKEKQALLKVHDRIIDSTAYCFFL